MWAVFCTCRFIYREKATDHSTGNPMPNDVFIVVVVFCLFISICLFVFHEVPDELQMSYAYIFVMFLECFEDLLDDLDDEDFLDEALLV